MANDANSKKSERIDEVIRHFRDRLEGGGRDGAERFVRQFYDRVPPEDLLAESAEQLSGAALSFWKFAAARRAGEVKVRVFSPQADSDGWESPHSVVEVVADDMPFMLDSLLAELTERSVGVHLITHPVLALRRDSDGRCVDVSGGGHTAEDAAHETWIHIAIDVQPSPEAHNEIARSLGGGNQLFRRWQAALFFLFLQARQVLQAGRRYF